MGSVNCLEAVPEVWEGAVPFMINRRTPLINYHWSISAWAGTILGDKIKEMVDAVDAGGPGNPEAPPDSGTIVRAEWDFDGSGSFPVEDRSIDGTKAEIETRASHVYDAPGTYMATLRVFWEREGQTQNRLRLIPNLTRVRVVVRDT